VEVFVGLEPIDLRWSFDRLAGLVVERLGREPRSRALFVRVPEPRGDAATVQLSESEFDELVAGLEAMAMPRKVKPRVH
jgi:hypothetical protein